MEYGTSWPGVRRVIEMANVDCSGLSLVESVGNFGGGTGMYEEIRDNRIDRWTEYSGKGPEGVWMLTARPLKQGIALTQTRQ